MFPLPITTWISIGSIVLALLGFGYGKYQHNQYVEFKAEVMAQAKIQEAKNESIQKQSDLVNKGIKNEYEAKLAAVRNYYSGLQRNSGSGSVSGISNPAIGANESPAYPVLVEQCARTTLQVEMLKEWVNAQIGIK